MKTEIKDLFEKDKNRAKKLARKVDVGKEFIYYDFSKTHITEEIIDRYLEKMDGFGEKIEGMFNGEKINYTEDRKVLHVALRDKEVLRGISGEDVKLDSDRKMVYDELMKIKGFVKDFDEGKICGVTGKRLEMIVNIGIGGSDLGPRMVCDALEYYGRKGIKTYFISNIDATNTIKVFEKIDPERALFIVVSKTFTTLETIKNAELSMRFLEKRLGKDRAEIASKHFVAVSSNVDEVRKHNISRVFSMWDFVGGRFSLWSAVGLSIVLYIGFDNFICLLRGASVVDEYFRKSRGRSNAEMMHAIVELFYSERGYNNKCLVSYDEYMRKFYLYLQQAEMESNGKPSQKTDTGYIIWGGKGTDVQHSFFQLLHQGTRKILTELLMPLKPLHSEEEYHRMVVANCLAQSRGLMIGKEDPNPEKSFEGDKPTVTVCYSKLTPETLGAMIAHYEHKIFILGLYWGINSFDQPGVTLGKKIAIEVLESFDEKKESEKFDESTNEMLCLMRSCKR
ncbi:glucose 6-phosphate isomerase [Encephalitozoon intestinalis ATCC 50506]|uniref:Glucose-6-phosphate isomerase n=1 Tax=Encephalitozoon intestinalis (strain ATCC 50506) TaxID=876142 RepID=E0S787_ENCIT|nr:glucose 6-phosphate isomerase [Encephalitozoon intestinalis ATCC 50506]ADM11515.1 glucose 6-phosphate isomerase [Encephalitozoon intestinalis ATCC 50506]UTX45228.1 glucose 6-phosphate isomerase [Encephalitozoon intestinalis]